jgi:arylsulfatase A-like enzyme
VNASRLRDATVHTVDIFHTLAALTGAELPNGVTLDGMSVRNMLRAPSTASAHPGARARDDLAQRVSSRCAS